MPPTDVLRTSLSEPSTSTTTRWRGNMTSARTASGVSTLPAAAATSTCYEPPLQVAVYPAPSSATRLLRARTHTQLDTQMRKPLDECRTKRVPMDDAGGGSVTGGSVAMKARRDATRRMGHGTEGCWGGRESIEHGRGSPRGRSTTCSSQNTQ
ncbi:hypothetical protein MKEN_00954500 [Mycena kentingensis (nom. inval.)]|nr:hypothetical protein MKEN_00954500 [Mycena kentingensis (nom. inval.)]